MVEMVYRTFERRLETVSKARELVAQTLDVTCPRFEDMRLCVSELASNAVQYATDQCGSYVVDVVRGAECVDIEVHDAGTQDPHSFLQPAEDLATSGRGLYIVDQLSDGWGAFVTHGHGKVVGACFHRKGGAMKGCSCRSWPRLHFQASLTTGSSSCGAISNVPLSGCPGL
ncbi:ATP-binding protein [Streptomyces sp. NPDC049936]|uniref:ATP-binding protein n=1 Tax=Streptomyces sp. NPDC049936 TaxID=3365599 RepID=UPI0037A3F741